MAGPQEARLRSALDGASRDRVDVAQQEWYHGSSVLRQVAQALESAAPNIRHQFGDQTGPAAAAAFLEVASRAQTRSAQMRDVVDALGQANEAMRSSEVVRDSFGGPLTEPSRPTPTPGPSTPEDVQARKQYDSDKASYDAAYAERERKAQAAADHMDTVFTRSTETMKQVHGEPDPPATDPRKQTTSGPGGAGSSPGGTPGSPSSPPRHPQGGGQVIQPPTGGGHHQTSTGGPGGGTSHPGGAWNPPPGSSQGATPTLPSAGGGIPGVTGASTAPESPGGIGGATAGGVAGAIGGGAIGGMTGIGGAVRGPMAVPTGTASGTTGSGRSIGSTSRAGGVRGALGRGGLVEEGAAGGRSSGARGAGGGTRGAGGGTRGAGGKSGSRGKAGARGGASGSQGGRNKKDPRKKGIDFFEDEQDWVDDEGAAPGVID